MVARHFWTGYFGRLTFCQFTFGRVTFGRVTLGLVTYGEVTFCRPTFVLCKIERPGIWSCDLVVNETPEKELHGKGTHIHTDGHRDFIELIILSAHSVKK